MPFLSLIPLSRLACVFRAHAHRSTLFRTTGNFDVCPFLPPMPRPGHAANLQPPPTPFRLNVDVHVCFHSTLAELVKPLPAEVRALMLARNRLATGMAEIGRVGLVGGEAEGQGGAALPPVIRQARECGMCFQNSECMLYHRAAEGGDEESSGLERGIFDGKVGYDGYNTHVEDGWIGFMLCAVLSILLLPPDSGKRNLPIFR